MKIQKPIRKSTPALISLWGPSGVGKTFSALKIAHGLVKNGEKVGVIDTENGRATIYSDYGDWMHLDLQPPFTPARYVEAMKEFEKIGGFGCVIIDSMSHIWEGEGGVLDMAENSRTQSGSSMVGLAKWKTPKMEHKKAVNYLIRAPFHVICCFRAKNLTKQVGRGKDASIETMGITPICGDKMIYEMTVSFLLGQDHKPVLNVGSQSYLVDPLAPAIKIPEPLKDKISLDGYLSEETGRSITQWIDGGQDYNKDAPRLLSVARDVASLGRESFEKHWKSLSSDEKKVVNSIMDELKSIMAEADRQTDIEQGQENDAPF